MYSSNPLPESYDDQGPFSDDLIGQLKSDNGLAREFLEFICGRRLGRGASREVFDYRIDEKYVIKIETGTHWYQNQMEATVWGKASEKPEHAKWFAPVKCISACGRILIMRKAEPLSVARAPTHLPSFFTDTKLENFGIIDNKVVALDYGCNHIMEKGLSARLKKVDWF